MPETISNPSFDICLKDYTLIYVPITPERATNLFAPDNLKKNGLNFIIGGFLFDISDLNVCAQYFEITAIKVRR